MDNQTSAGPPYPIQERAFQRTPLHDLQDWRPAVPPPRLRFQHRWRTHLILLVLTLITTAFSGGCQWASYVSDFGRRPYELDFVGYMASGFRYGLSVLFILGSHEMGHYLLCRRYNVDASLPYFLPAPLLTGTLGAVIRIKEAFPTRAALFDIGIAGPIAGFVALVPVLVVGIWLSPVTLSPPMSDVGLVFGEPLLLQAVAWLVHGRIPDGHTLNLHPMGWAALFGMLATALNLLPFGQLDGGHITYATLGGRWATPISLLTALAAVGMTIVSSSWIVIALMMLAMLFLLGPRHPPVLFNEPTIGPGRIALAVFAIVMFAVCFTPVPVEEPLDLIPAGQTQQASR